MQEDADSNSSCSKHISTDGASCTRLNPDSTDDDNGMIFTCRSIANTAIGMDG